MTKKSMFTFLLVALCVAPIVAQEPVAPAAPATDSVAPPKMERLTTEATWPEGKLTITYGSPVWKEEFAKEMESMGKGGEVWRLGNNQPTTATLTSGLHSADGAIPPGTYGLALRAAGNNTWDLLVYEGLPIYEKGMPLKTWAIKGSGPAAASKDLAKSLKIDVSNKGAMKVSFGPMVAGWDLKPIKVNPAVKTEFADATSTFEILALPLAGVTFKDTLVGVASTVRNDITVRYHLKLTVEGDKSTLNFVNERASGIAKEKEWFDNLTTRIGKMIEEHPERKEHVEPILAGFKKDQEVVDAMVRAYERLNPTTSLTGTVAKSDKKNTELTLMYDEAKDRKAGAIMLNLGLENSTASFEVKPRGQFVKRRSE